MSVCHQTNKITKFSDPSWLHVVFSNDLLLETSHLSSASCELNLCQQHWTPEITTKYTFQMINTWTEDMFVHICTYWTPSCRDASCIVWRVIWIFKYTTCQTAAEGNPPDEIYNVMGTFWCISICCKYKQQLSAGIMLLPCFKYNI